MKVSTRSALLSALTIATMLSSSLAMAQLTPGKIEDQNRRAQPQQHGLTPGQIQADNDNQQALDEARERERLERDRQRERDARAAEERERIRREEERREAIRREQLRRFFAEQERIRLEREAQDRADALFREQQRLAEEARRLQEEREAEARKGSASIAFSGVTRKTGGEWLRVILKQPMQLGSIEISVLEAKAKIHAITLHADNGQQFALQADGRIILSTDSGAQFHDMRSEGILNRITVIDMRVESMGAKSVIGVKVNSLEGVPSLAKQKFPASK